MNFLMNLDADEMALYEQVVSAEEQAHHYQEAQQWYVRGIRVLDEVKARGVAFDWEVHPDTLVAEREALERATPPPLRALQTL